MLSKIKNFVKTYNLYDEQFSSHPKNYILQCLLIFICISLILFLYELVGAIVIASLGASCFIVFMVPLADNSRPRFVIGGYICGSIIGVLFGLLHSYVGGLDLYGSQGILIVISAAAVGLASLLMAVTNTEHPPAAALTLGLVLSSGRLLTAPVAIFSVIIFCIVRQLLKKHLRNLL